MRVSSAQFSPHYLSGPHLSWLLLTICYARSFSGPSTSSTYDEEIESYVGLDSSVASDLAVYLVRSWDEVEPPPASLSDLCSTLSTTLRHSAIVRSGAISASVSAQITKISAWLVFQWDLLCTGGIPSIASGWLVKIVDAAGSCLEGEGTAESGLRLLDRRSPLGIPIRRMRLAHESLDEIKDLTKLFKILQAWRDHNDSSTTSPPSDASLLQSSGRPTRLEVYAAYQDARRRGDYTATRENLAKFFELAPVSATPTSSSSNPQPVRRTKIHPHALLNFAALQVENHEWFAAEQTLQETIQLARTERDEQCLHACQSLERRIKAASKATARQNHGSVDDDHGEPMWKGSERAAYFGSLTMDDLWEIQTAAGSGASVEILMAQMDRVLAVPFPHTARPGNSHTHKGPQVATGEPARTMIAQDRVRPWTVAAALAQTKGGVAAADRFRHLYRAEPFQDDEDRREKDELAMRMQEAWELAEAGRYNEGLALLIDRSVISTMSLTDYHRWTQSLCHILYLQAHRRGATSAMARIIEALGERDVLHLIEIWNAPPQLKRLYTEAKTLVDAGLTAKALSAVRAFITAAENASRLPLVVQGKLLEARLLADNMGEYHRSCQALDTVMSATLTDHNLERRANVCARYAQSLCGPDLSQLKSNDATRAVEWYQVALRDYETISPYTSAQRVSTLRQLALLHNHLGDVAKRDEYSEHFVELQSRLEGCGGGAERQFDLGEWENLIARVGDRIAGLRGGPLATKPRRDQ